MNITKIKFIPTELNLINYTKQQLLKHKKAINKNTLLIYGLFIWNLLITTVILINIINPLIKLGY